MNDQQYYTMDSRETQKPDSFSYEPSSQHFYEHNKYTGNSLSQRSGSLLGLSKLLIKDSNNNHQQQHKDLTNNSTYSLKSTKVGFNPPQNVPVMSPNLFHNPLTSGMNSIKHSPAGGVHHNNSSSIGSSTQRANGNTFNHTATFAANSLGNITQSDIVNRPALKDITQHQRQNYTQEILDGNLEVQKFKERLQKLKEAAHQKQPTTSANQTLEHNKRVMEMRMAQLPKLSNLNQESQVLDQNNKENNLETIEVPKAQYSSNYRPLYQPSKIGLIGQMERRKSEGNIGQQQQRKGHIDLRQLSLNRENQSHSINRADKNSKKTQKRFIIKTSVENQTSNLSDTVIHIQNNSQSQVNLRNERNPHQLNKQVGTPSEISIQDQSLNFTANATLNHKKSMDDHSRRIIDIILDQEIPSSASQTSKIMRQSAMNIRMSQTLDPQNLRINQTNQKNNNSSLNHTVNNLNEDHQLPLSLNVTYINHDVNGNNFFSSTSQSGLSMQNANNHDEIYRAFNDNYLNQMPTPYLMSEQKLEQNSRQIQQATQANAMSRTQNDHSVLLGSHTNNCFTIDQLAHNSDDLPQENHAPKRWKDLNVIQRNEIFLQNRDRKIESAREAKKYKETEGCTFEPTTLKNVIGRPPAAPMNRSQLRNMCAPSYSTQKTMVFSPPSSTNYTDYPLALPKHRTTQKDGLIQSRSSRSLSRDRQNSSDKKQPIQSSYSKIYQHKKLLTNSNQTNYQQRSQSYSNLRSASQALNNTAVNYQQLGYARSSSLVSLKNEGYSQRSVSRDQQTQPKNSERGFKKGDYAQFQQLMQDFKTNTSIEMASTEQFSISLNQSDVNLEQNHIHLQNKVTQRILKTNSQQQAYFSIASDLGVVSEASDELANDSQTLTLTKVKKNTYPNQLECGNNRGALNLDLEQSSKFSIVKESSQTFDRTKHQEKLIKAKETLARIKQKQQTLALTQ